MRFWITVTVVMVFAAVQNSVGFADEKPKAPSKPSAKAQTEKKQLQKKKQEKTVNVPVPTMESVSYGPHPKQVLSFWKADSPKPTPLLFFIHGGGWQGGDRMKSMDVYVPAMHKAGISVISIEYRFIDEAIADKVEPPVKGCLHDAARALQFVRSKAGEWNIDKTRIAAAGGSAGACTSLWLAFHDDLADPQSDDLVARESTRLLCAAVTGAQTTLDPVQMKEWTPNSHYGSHAFGIYKQVNGKKERDFEAFLKRRDEIMPWIQEYSPYALVSAGDSPVYLTYASSPELGKEQKDPTHTSNFGVKLQEHCLSTGVDCELVYPGAPDVKHKTVEQYIIEKLTAF